jgi:hypothetical protein
MINAGTSIIFSILISATAIPVAVASLAASIVMGGTALTLILKGMRT